MGEEHRRAIALPDGTQVFHSPEEERPDDRHGRRQPKRPAAEPRKGLAIKSPNKSLGAFLKERRTALGLSQADLARDLGYGSPQYVSDWERGHSGVPMKRLLALADALEIDRDTLFDLLLDFSLQRVESELKAEYQGMRATHSRAKK